jgi:predicted Zn finger-like uncharacterized protein
VSWLTTCPHCGTTFRVNQQQLDAYQGEVRCGKCQRVFNACRSLKTEAPASAAGTPPAEEIVAETAAESPARPLETGVSAVEEAASPLAEAVEPAPDILIHEPAADEGGVTEGAAVLAEAEAPAASTEPQPEPEAQETGNESDQAASAVEAAEPEEKAAKPRRLGWLWGLGSLLLALLLGGQVFYVYRAEIAARAPGMQPLLSQMCDVLQCRVGLPRHIELLGIDSSDLQADPQRPNVLILNATLRSRAPVTQEYPLLELTLTDASDQALLRRVFVPAEYLPQGKDVAAGIPAAGEMAIKLNLQVRDIQPVGYRLYLFYPEAG